MIANLTAYLTKVHIIETKITPYFAKKSIAEITVPDILQWQNELLKKSDSEGKSYSQTYLRTIQNQLNAILNRTNQYYGLTSNPAHKTTKMVKSKAQATKYLLQFLHFLRRILSCIRL